MQSDAETPEQYLAELPPDRAEAISAVRTTILEHLPDGYTEQMRWGMISYEIPLERFPDTYNGEPLMYAALASQKNHMAIYLTNVYSDGATEAWFRQAWTADGRSLDMGKSCVRFKKLENVPLDVVGQAIARTGVDDFIAIYARARA